MDCNPLRLANWNDWSNFSPVDPLEIIANCSFQGDTGAYLNSSTFAAPTPSIIPTPEVVGVNITKGTPLFTVLANMPVDIIILSLNVGDVPQIIDITFSSPFDPTSVTATTFTVIKSGIPVGGAISFPLPNIARFTSTVPFAIGTYVVTLVGATLPPHITFFGGSTILDGDPTQLPSGDGVPGGSFTFQFQVLPMGASPTYPPANIGGWNGTLFTMLNDPMCEALGTDNAQLIADANQWGFQHETANLNSSNPLPLQNVMFLRAGQRWSMTIPLNLGGLKYPDIQLGFQNDAGTRGDCQGTIPVISFTNRSYTGIANLILTLKKTGRYKMGLRAIDSRGNYFMYESTWIIII